MRTIEELRTIANEMGKPLEILLYEMLSDAMKENEKYKSNNKKAIEFIKEWWYEKNTRDINRIVSLGDKRIDLLNILEGGDE